MSDCNPAELINFPSFRLSILPTEDEGVPILPNFFLSSIFLNFRAPCITLAHSRRRLPPWFEFPPV